MKKIAVAVLLLVSAVSAKANVTSSIGFSTPDLVEADASPTGNINTATTFTLQGFSTTHNVSGVFVGLPIQDFGTVTLIPGTSPFLTVADHAFGMFSGDSTSTVANGNGFLNLLIEGDWIPGSSTPLTCGSDGCPAELRIAMTQTPAKTGEISLSGTMSIVNGVVPEPPTALLFLTGTFLVLVGTRLRNLLALN